MNLKPVASGAETNAVSERGQSLTTAPLPEASFVTVLRLGGALTIGPGTLTELLDRLEGSARTSEEVGRMAAEVLLRAGLAQLDGDSVVETSSLHELDSALDERDLDRASELFQRYEPYHLTLVALRDEHQISSPTLLDPLRHNLGAQPSKDAVERLIRIPVYLGQGWTDGQVIRDGTARPSDEDIATATVETIDEIATDGLCAVADLLPTVCRRLNLSVWAAHRALASLVESGSLRSLSFPPSAGRRSQARDQVVTGSLRRIRLIPIPLDRIVIGGRPVFTVTRSSS